MCDHANDIPTPTREGKEVELISVTRDCIGDTQSQKICQTEKPLMPPLAGHEKTILVEPFCVIREYAGGVHFAKAICLNEIVEPVCAACDHAHDMLVLSAGPIQGVP